MSSLNFDSYNVGIICALPIELQALRCSLHKEHPSLPNQPRADRNIYSYGEISGHNIVITCLPKGITGEVSAAHAVTTLSCTFPNLRFGLFIGIGGGIPKLEGLNQADIRLGDIVVSAPEGSHGGVVQYHRGKMVDGEFQRVGALNKPPLLLLNALSSVEALLDFEPGVINEILQSMRGKIKGARRQKLLEYPGRSKDHLFHSFYHHRPNSATCHGLCDLAQTVERDWEEREEDEFEPRVFTGTIASSSVVVKDSRVRDQIQDAYGAKCVEMEAAGVMDFFPCLVIRGISDYADSHKNDDWHRYAALSAAAYGSLLLRNIPAAAVQQLPTTKAVLEEKEKSGDATPLDVYDKPAPTPSREAVLERKGNIEAIPDRQAGLGDKEKAGEATPLQPHETPVYKPPLDLPGPPKKAPSSKSDGHNVEALPEQAQTPRDKTHDSRTAPSIVVEPSPPDALKRSKTSPVVDEVLLHQPSVGLPNSLERDERPRPSKTTTSQVGDNNPSLTGQQSPRTACVCGAASEKAIPNSSSEAGPKEGLSTASPGVAVPHKTEDAAPPPAPAADTFNKATSSSMLAGFPFDLELEPPMLPESNFAVLTLPLGGSRLQYDRSDRTSTEFKLVPELPFLQTLIFYQTADGEVVVSKGWNCSESGRRRRTPAESIGVRNAKLRTPLTATAYVLGPYNNSLRIQLYYLCGDDYIREFIYEEDGTPSNKVSYSYEELIWNLNRSWRDGMFKSCDQVAHDTSLAVVYLGQNNRLSYSSRDWRGFVLLFFQKAKPDYQLYYYVIGYIWRTRSDPGAGVRPLTHLETALECTGMPELALCKRFFTACLGSEVIYIISGGWFIFLFCEDSDGSIVYIPKFFSLSGGGIIAGSVDGYPYRDGPDEFPTLTTKKFTSPEMIEIVVLGKERLPGVPFVVLQELPVYDERGVSSWQHSPQGARLEDRPATFRFPKVTIIWVSSEADVMKFRLCDTTGIKKWYPGKEKEPGDNCFHESMTKTTLFRLRPRYFASHGDRMRFTGGGLGWSWLSVPALTMASLFEIHPFKCIMPQNHEDAFLWPQRSGVYR